jgi:hypothetical protein
MTGDRASILGMGAAKRLLAAALLAVLVWMMVAWALA